MNKLSAIWQLFKVGNSVVDAAKWKKRQISATVLAAALLAVINVLAAFGYAMPVDAETANAIAAGIIAVVNTILTITTTDKIGISESAGITNSSTDSDTEPQEEIKVETKENPPSAMYGTDTSVFK